MINAVHLLDNENSTQLVINSDGSINSKITDGTNTVTVRHNEHVNEYELAVNLRGHVCAENTSSTPLGISGTFTGDWQDTLDFGMVVIGIKTDKNSATNGLKVEWSSDGVTADQDDMFTIMANQGKVFTFGPANRYVRVIYTNGTQAQTSFKLQTILRRVYVKPSSHRINDSIIAEDDAELVKAVLTGQNPSGNFINFQASATGNLKVTDAENGLAISKGVVTDTTFIHKFGNAPDFDTTDGAVTVWDGANDAGINLMDYIYSSTADIDSISSSNNGDTQNIEIQGLDSNYALVTQTVALTGQTRKALTTSLIRVFRMKNVDATNIAGTMYCYVNTALTAGVPTDNTKVRAVISNGNNQTLMAVYTIPAGKTGYMRDWYASVGGASKSSQYIIDVYARPFGQVFQLKHRSSISDVGTSYIQHNYNEPEVFSEKTDLEIHATATAIGVTGASVSAGFDIVLVNN